MISIEFVADERSFAWDCREFFEPESHGPEYTAFDMAVRWWIEGVNVLQAFPGPAAIATHSIDTAYVPILGFTCAGYRELRDLRSGEKRQVLIGSGGWLFLGRSGRRLVASTVQFPTGAECDYDEALQEFRSFVRRVRSTFEVHAPRMLEHPSAPSWFAGAEESDRDGMSDLS